MMEIGKKGVLALLCESSYSKNDGYTSPNHKLTAKIESIFWRCFRTYYYFKLCTKMLLELKKIAQLAKKYNRKICFYGRDKYDNTNSLMRIAKNKKKPILDIHPACIGDNNDIQKNKDNE